MAEPHPTAAGGFQAAADDYERYRPGYPAALTSLLATELSLNGDAVVLDLAAGTGKLTGHLISSGADVVAVEPVAAMREHLRLARPRVAVLSGVAEDLPLPTAALDAVAVGQAFHWFDHDTALSEIARVLRPDGHLAIVFNERELRSTPQAALDELLAPHRGQTPSWADHMWQQVLEDPAGFTVVRTRELSNDQRVDLDGFLGRVRSVSFVALLDEHTRAELLGQCRSLFESLQHDGRVTLDYRTRTWVLRRAS